MGIPFMVGERGIAERVCSRGVIPPHKGLVRLRSCQWGNSTPGPSSLGAKWFRYRVPIHHPLGFYWYPLEGAGLHQLL